MKSLQYDILPIKAFNDNYIWLIKPNASQYITLVDPGDANVCLQYIEENKLILHTILITHHHNDHIGGVDKLKDYCKSKNWPLTVYGPLSDNIHCVTVDAIESDIINIKDTSLSFNVLALPGHTHGHIAYVSDNEVFCGDTLFSGGCGRIFEGTPTQMFNSLSKLASLPTSIKVYCAHEYTMANLAFAKEVNSSNRHLTNYIDEVISLREQGKPTIPTSIEKELLINPFLRCNDEEIIQSTQRYSNQKLSSDEAVFTQLRVWKDKF